MYVPRRLDDVVGFGIDRVARAAVDRPDGDDVLRMENLDTDVPPPPQASEAVRDALGDPAANSYLPFTGRRSLRAAIAAHVSARSGVPYDPDRQVVVTAGGTQAILSALLAVVDPGDEVVVTDPTYAGIVHRVTLAGARPVAVALDVVDGRWRLDGDRLAAAVGPRTRALVLMSPSMPTGHVLSAAEWDAVAAVCRDHDLWLLFDAAMERLVFDGAPSAHPASLPGLADRVVTLGSLSKEQRMIGWRIGWIVGPDEFVGRAAWTSTYAVVTPPGLSQPAAEAVLSADGDRDVGAFTATLQQRRDVVVDQLAHLPLVVPDGGWSLLVDAVAMGTDPEALSAALLARGGVAATPMTGWGGPVADRHLRLVFSREPVARLATLRERFRRAGW